MGAIAKVLNFISNDQKLNVESLWCAINRSMAVIEFTLDGEIVFANENFFKCVRL